MGFSGHMNQCYCSSWIVISKISASYRLEVWVPKGISCWGFIIYLLISMVLDLNLNYRTYQFHSNFIENSRFSKTEEILFTLQTDSEFVYPLVGSLSVENNTQSHLKIQTNLKCWQKRRAIRKQSALF